MLNEQHIKIGTLRMRAGAGSTKTESIDRYGLRNRFAFLFNTIDFIPAGMPPSGILLVKHMTDPLPGKFFSPLSRYRVNPQWEQAVQQKLMEKFQHARRPRQGYIPPDVEAVFFADEAEMAATWIRSVNKNQTNSPDQWWWRKSKYGRYNLDQSEEEIKRVLCEEIRFLPAIFYYLRHWNLLQEVVGALSIKTVERIITTLSDAFRLEAVVEPLLSVKVNKRIDEINGSNGKSGNYGSNGNNRRREAEKNRIKETKTHSTLLRKALIKIGLSPYHYSHYSHNSQDSRDSQDSGETPIIKSILSPKSHYSQDSRETPKVKASLSPNSPNSSPVIPPATWGSFEKSPHDLTNRLTGKQKNVEIDKNEIIGLTPFQMTPFQKKITGPVKDESNALPNLEDQSHHEWALQLSGEGVETELGGIFYLVNVMERLQLMNNHLNANAWTVIKLLAKSMLSETYPEPTHDAIWEILALLENHDPTQPDPTQTQQWVDNQLPRINSFLEKALPTGKKMPLQTPARIYVTTTHVDIVMALEDISLDIRIAGLDRNPGWVDYLERIILFHFK